MSEAVETRTWKRPTTFTPQQDAAILSMRKAGMSCPAIGREIGRTADSVRGRLYTITSPASRNARRYRELGPPLKDKPIVPIDDSGYVAKCIAGGGFPGLKFKPGRVFSYRNGQRIEVTL